MTNTLGFIQRETAALLRNVSDAPALEAGLLIEHVTGSNRTQQHASPDTIVTASQLNALQQLRQQRLTGTPLAYLLGEAHFWTLKLHVNSAVLIPRPETELVVERALLHLVDDHARVLDLGTGSGAIALAIATERPHARVWASDRSSAALAVARGNAAQCGVNNVEFYRSDWFTALPPQAYRLIVSNPPYIAVDDPHLAAAVLAHEPEIALIAGPNGLEALQTIVTHAPKYLQPNGWLVMEHGWQQAAAVRELLESTGYCSVASHADLAGHQRVTEGQWPH